MRRWRRIVAGIVIVVIAIVGIGVGVLHHQTYAPSASATHFATEATKTNYGIYFKPKRIQGPTVIFYPGALVAPASYSVWAKQIADAGYPVAIVSFPLDLAVLNGNAAATVPVGHDGYVIGGHSLGGVMACRYATTHAKQRRGVFLLASYPDQKGSLRHSDLPVLSLTGSRDGVLDWHAWQTAKRFLPVKTQYAQLTGGNHAGFGSYGAQRGDRSATVSNTQQQRWVANQLSEWLKTRVRR